MKSLLTIAALSLLSGCCGNERLWYIDSRFSPEEERQIRLANDMWCTGSHSALCMDLVFGARVDVSEVYRQAIVKVGSRGAQYRFQDQLGHAAFFHPGGTFDSNLIVVLSDQVAPEDLRVTVAHEMGHTFGAGHINDPMAVMFHNLEGAANKEVLTCSDLSLVGLPCEQSK